jgi:hypothetical protein
MMTVIIDDRNPLQLAFDLKTSVDASEMAQASATRERISILADRDGSQGIGCAMAPVDGAAQGPGFAMMESSEVDAGGFHL